MLTELTKDLQRKMDLSEPRVAQAVAALTDEGISAETKADFLTALAQKGETIDEITAFARALRARAIEPPLDKGTRAKVIIDVCGTGGDRLNTFNISTTVSLIVAAAGVPVAKHGNRAVTSQSGSADVLDALGIPVDLEPEAAANSLRDHQFVFLFAPKYHPGFRHIAPARRLCAQRGQRTLFNLLGPLLNPARPSAQLLGVPAGHWCEPIGRALQSLGARRGMVVSGRVGEAWLDELSILGDNTIAEFYQDRGFTVGTTSIEGFPVQPCRLEDLSGGDPQANAETVRQLLDRRERGPKRDAVLLNAGAALFVADQVRSVEEGWGLAEELIDSGRAAAKLASLVKSKK